MKSLKLYINSYRNVGIFHEAAVNKILTDLVCATRPWKMEVWGDFNVRGNIKTIIRAKFKAEDYDTAGPSGQVSANPGLANPILEGNK